MDKYEIIEILKEGEGFISGEEIGNKMEVTRANVWKMMQKLKQEGYEIDSSTNRGYQLLTDEFAYNQREIEKHLKTERFGKEIFFLKRTDSTNGQLKKQALEGAKEGTLFVAESMSRGKGRLGRKWHAPKQSGIWASLLLRPDMMPKDASAITLLTALAVVRALIEETNIQTHIKWPNDIVLYDRKICGILTEMDCEMEQINFVVLGIGINVNMEEFPEELQGIATSLYRIKNKEFGRTKILTKTLEILEEYYEIFLERGFEPFMEEYERRCITLNQDIVVHGKKTFEARAVGITKQGELLIERVGQTEQEIVSSGEVSIRGVM